MPAPCLAPNAENCSLEELIQAQRCTPRQPSFIRLKAMEALLLGFERGQVAQLYHVTERTLYSWIRRFNISGIDGLIDKPRSGRPRVITIQQSTRYRQLIENPEEAGQVHWTAKKFHGYLREELDHEVGYSTLVRWLREQGFRFNVPQPWPDRQDETKRQAFVKQVKTWLSNPDMDLWYSDETGMEGDPRPRRRWVQKGSKPRVTKNGDHLRMNVTGMVCPRTGQFYALEFTHSDTDCFQAFLNEANRDVVIERKRNLLIVDNASWHKAKRLNWGQFEPIFLPPYSPDLNPIEKLWMVMKAEWFTDFVAKNKDHLIARIDQALNWLIQRHSDNQKTCAIKKKL